MSVAWLLGLLCMTLLSAGNAWGGVKSTLKLTDFSKGSYNNPNASKTCYSSWTSSQDSSPQVTISTTDNARDIWPKPDNKLHIAPGLNHQKTFKVKLSAGYVIRSLTFSQAQAIGADFTLTSSGTSTSLKKDATAQDITVGNINSQTLDFTIAGTNDAYGAHTVGTCLTIEVEKLCAITYHLKSATGSYDHTWTALENADGTYAKTVPNNMQRPFCTYEFYADEAKTEQNVDLSGETANVYVRYTVDASALKNALGWEYTTDLSKPKWYFLNFNTDAASPTKHWLNGSGAALPATLPNAANMDSYLWAFVGDPYGMRIVNKAKGTSVYLSSPTAPASINTHDKNETLVFPSAEQYDLWELCLFKTSNNDYRQNDFAFMLQGAAYKSLMALQGNCLRYYANESYGDASWETGGKIIFDASASLTATASRKVMYKVYRSDEDMVAQLTDSVYAPVGPEPNLPVSLRRGFCQYSYDHELVTDTTTCIRTDYFVSGLPFTPSDDKSHLLYYTMTVDNNNRQVYDDTNHNHKVGVSTRIPLTQNNVDCWGFVGDPYGLTIYNRNTGTPLGVLESNLSQLNEGVNNADLGPKLSSDGTYKSEWELFDTNSSTVTNNLCFRLKGTHVYMSLNGFVGLRLYSESADDALMDAKANIVNAPSALVFYVRDAVAVNVAFHVYDGNGQKLYDVTANTTKNAAPYIPASALRAFLTVGGYYTDATLTTPMSTVTANTKDVYVKVSEADLPFTVSDPEKDEWHWYYLRIRNGDQYVSAFGPGPYQTTNDNPYEPQSLWAFAGNVADGFVVYNRWFGKKYILTNINKDIYASGAVDENHERYMGPVLQYKTETAADTAKWYLVNGGKGTDGKTMFGLTNKAYPNMSVNVHTRYHDVGFYYWDATKAINSRLKVEAYQEKAGSTESGTQTAALATLRSRIATLKAHQGGVFSFKSSVTVPDISENSTVSAGSLEAFITDPANYVRPESVPYARIKSAGGKFLKVAPASLVTTAGDDVSAKPLLADYSNSDAGLVFHFKFVEAGDNYKWTSQGIYMQPVGTDTTSTWASGSGEPSQNVYVYSKGAGMACIAVTPLTQYPYMHVMKTSSDGATVMGGAFNQAASSWYVIPATADTMKMLRPSTYPDGDAWAGNSFLPLMFEFPVEVNANEGNAYYCEAQSGATATMTPFADNKVPANTPFIVRSTSGAESLSLTILDTNPTAVSGDLLNGVLLKTDISAGDQKYAFGYTSVTGNWVDLGDGKKTGWAFRKTSKAASFGPNKAYLSLPSSSAQAFRIVFSDDEATGIATVSNTFVDDGAYYNLQGMRVDHPTKGVYIHNKKKIIVH
ncbi:MAG: hypothetical protein SOY06_06335 [Prevotella sp.]|nr:hypothetical protein [Bacteroidales bacterium]MDY4229447.1 hypothetical protein [Prevotella sp.]